MRCSGGGLGERRRRAARRGRTEIAAASAAAALLALALGSCSPLRLIAASEIHVHDRHSLSYRLVEAYARAHPGTTLVLLDYHHDVGPLSPAASSSDWAGRLILEGRITRMVWVSGRDLLLPNKNARIAWLRRKVSSFTPAEAESILSKVELADWASLRAGRLKGPLAVCLDLDILCHDPGDPPGRFLDEIDEWMAKQRPSLLTVSLSAAYQREPSQAWSWLERFARGYAAPRGARWYLEAGTRELVPEGAEEAKAWKAWERDPDEYQRAGAAFRPGSAIWIAPPATLRAALLERKIAAGDGAAADAIAGWTDPRLPALEEMIASGAGDRALGAAARALRDGWAGRRAPLPEPSSTVGLGLALRISRAGSDRGCLALPEGVAGLDAAAAYCAQEAAADPRYPPVAATEAPDLELELCLFGPWTAAEGALDFRPGLDSLILVDREATTLLQAPVAAERGYGHELFLRRLSLKAGLGPEGWKGEGVEFRKAVSAWSRRKLVDIEAGAQGLQKQEKK
jgi:hypothetical protein